MITHTAALKEAYEALSLKGAFDTLATGKQKGDHNCFCFPLPNGAWAVYRYSPGTAEANSWQRSEQGWTYCYLNQILDLKAAANSFGGIKAPDGSFVFESADDAKKVLNALGSDLNLPIQISHRETSLKMQNGDLVAQIPYENSDKPQEMRQEGWLQRGKNWVKVFEIEKPASQEDQANPSVLDDRIRHLVTPTMEEAGWVLRDTKGRWVEEPKTNIKSVLKFWGLSDKETEAALGHMITNPWDLVNLPFEEEFPGDRRWNRDAAKLAVAPTEEDREMVHPHWNRIFEHCGEGLDEAVTENKWCIQNGIRSGADYLRLWAAILFQKPTHPLPYLFFFSERQNTGKSTFHQSLGLLMRLGKGYVEADSALTNQQGFNRQLAGAILCYVEETNLNNTGSRAYERIKNWVTGDNISIHPKGVDP